MTILSSKNKFFFVHLHKCGGTSIEASYENVAHWSDFVIGSAKFSVIVNDYFHAKIGINKHSSVMDIVNAIGIDEYQEMTGFALVRNPFSIYESFYSWIGKIFAYHARINALTTDDIKQKVAAGGEEVKQLQFSSWGASKAFANSSSFNEFVEISLERQFLPQTSLCQRLGVGTKFEPRFIFKLEDIDQFWIALENHLGTSLERTHANVSKAKNGYAWSKKNIERVGALFSQDIEFFKFQHRPEAS